MELKIDLLKRKVVNNSRHRVFFGMYSLGMVSGWIITKIIIGKEIIKPFDWIYFGVFALIGIVVLVTEGLARYFRKAYILINSEIISLRADVFEKEQFINWNEIKSIDYMVAAKFKIKKTDDTTMIIDLSKFDYALLQEIKKVVDCIAKEKDIQTNF